MSKINFLNFLKACLAENDSEYLEVVFEAIRLRCKDDFELYCEIFFSHFLHHPWNQFHQDIFEYYRKKESPSRLVDGAPRGYAKSTIKTLFKILHDVCYGLQSYIIIVSDTTKQSNEKLKDVRSEVFENELLRAVYNVHFKTKRPNSQSFEVHSDVGTCFLRSVSAGVQVRGLRYRDKRPSKIILDDAESSEKILSEEQREKTENWFKSDISQLGSNKTDIEIVGTVLHRDSLLMKLKKNPAYTTKIYKAVLSWPTEMNLWNHWSALYTNLDDEHRLKNSNKYYEQNKEEMNKGAQVLWPEKEDILFLMKEKIEIGDRAFASEKQNQPMPKGETLFDKVWWYKEKEIKRKKYMEIENTGALIPYSDCEAYGSLDPATGESNTKDKNKLDYSSLIVGLKDLKGRLFVDKDWTKRAKPSEYIKQVFIHNSECNFTKFVVEENLFRGLLTENIQREKKEREEQRRKSGMRNWGLKVPFYQIENRENKTQRIYTLEPKINHGWILFNRNLSIEFMDMIEQFPSKEVHDDGPDALEMLWSLVNNRYKYKPLNLNTQGRI